ncbi:pathogenesis-related thaumatin superfamily protein [Actinidia rufa]|uniref:Pathogenesis-related thaumatin superfamily protein n=1 Tax=Actinidia rufa TaxID=165716 RepID=A0A7J0ETX3_9ERIC|nr:pathogenesis-related thaumatin superfamily protein [Actinidia rufa]
MARDTNGRRQDSAHPHRLHPRERQVPDPHGAQCLVGSTLGPDPLLPRLRRKILLRHRRLRLRQGPVRRLRRNPSGDPCRVHPHGDQGLDFYDVSLVDGYNLPILVVARGGKRGGCSSTGCLVDLNGACPAEMRVARGNSSGSCVACKSACEAFGDPQYCCSEGYSTPDTCRPSAYSQFFKHACPRSYSYAYDDQTSTFTCASADYTIIFCPKPYTR